MSSKVYKVIVIGPTGAGKSQFCNFFQRDLSNSIKLVIQRNHAHKNLFQINLQE